MILPKMSSSELNVHFRHYLKLFLQCKIRDKMLEDVMLMQQTLMKKSNFKQDDKTKKKEPRK